MWPLWLQTLQNAFVTKEKEGKTGNKDQRVDNSSDITVKKQIQFKSINKWHYFFQCVVVCVFTHTFVYKRNHLCNCAGISLLGFMRE